VQLERPIAVGCGDRNLVGWARLDPQTFATLPVTLPMLLSLIEQEGNAPTPIAPANVGWHPPLVDLCGPSAQTG
jgi:hypothetical protein